MAIATPPARQNSFQRILTGLASFGMTLVVGTLGYGLFGWSLLKAFYLVAIAVFGVGYGEVEPIATPAEKLFTIGIIVAGTSSAVYVVGGFIPMATKGESNRTLDSQRRSREFENRRDRVITFWTDCPNSGAAIDPGVRTAGDCRNRPRTRPTGRRQQLFDRRRPCCR